MFQRRRHAQLDFNRNWTDYEEGFGDPQYEHWLGLKKINCLTFSVCAAELRIDMTDYKGIHKYAIYSSISVLNAANKYRLDLGAYHGTAGDGMRACGSNYNYTRNSDGMPFSTPDRDNDNWSGNCAQYYSAGWWYKQCFCSNLNTPYNNNGYIFRWNTFSSYLKCSEMKLRSRD